MRRLALVPLLLPLVAQKCAKDDDSGSTTGTHPSSNPTYQNCTTEICNGLDDDCDGQVDEGLTVTKYTDQDEDGWGADPVQACEDEFEQLAGQAGDCDDTNAAVFPGAPDVAGDGVDSDCDTLDCTTGLWGSMTVGLCSYSGDVAGAADVCTAFGGELMSIRNGAEQANVVSLMQRTDQRLALIGLGDATTEGVYTWGDGSPFGYANWAYGEPNNNYDPGVGEDCGAVQADFGYGWNDVDCGFAFSGVAAACQRDRVDMPFTVFSGTQTFVHGTTDAAGAFDPLTDYDCRIVYETNGTPVPATCDGCVFSFQVVGTVVDNSEANGVSACMSRDQPFQANFVYVADASGEVLSVTEYYSDYDYFSTSAGFDDFTAADFSYTFVPSTYLGYGAYAYREVEVAIGAATLE